MTLAVTLVKVGSGHPVFELGAYQYTGTRIPVTGDTITVTRTPGVETHGARQRLVYVTRVDPQSEIPIRAVEAGEDRG